MSFERPKIDMSMIDENCIVEVPSERSPLLRKAFEEESASESRLATILIAASLGVNVSLFLVKVFALVISHSLSVVASVMDSTLDLVSQAMIWYAHRQSSHVDEAFPAGKKRLSPIGILILATLMFAGAVEVVHESVETLIKGFYTDYLPEIDFSMPVVATLMFTVSIKIVLFWASRYMKGMKSNPTVQALADDHRNDILTNLCAVLCGTIAYRLRAFWFVDAFGGIALSAYIAVCWVYTGRGTMNELVGADASQEHKDLLHELIKCHQKRVKFTLTCLRAYHSGHFIIVEVELIMPVDASLAVFNKVAHDLQHDLENLRFVERAFVSISHEFSKACC